MNPSPLPRPTRILVVDDHGIVRDGIALLLAGESALQVVGFASTGETAIAGAVRLEPDVIIMDLVLPDLNGVEATQRILQRLPRTLVIALSASHTAEHVYQALRAGARGYLTKEALGTELVVAVRAVLAGNRHLSALVAGFFSDDSLSLGSHRSPIERLSAREREVLHRTVAGTSTADIARFLSLSSKTVDTYRSRLMRKLGVRNRSSLIRLAIEHGFAPM